MRRTQNCLWTEQGLCCWFPCSSSDYPFSPRRTFSQVVLRSEPGPRSAFLFAWTRGGASAQGEGVCLFEWWSRDRAVTSPALPGLAPAEPEAKTSSATERDPMAARWLGPRPPARTRPRGPGSRRSPSLALSRGGRGASRAMAGMRAVGIAGSLPPASASLPHLPCPLPTPSPLPRAESGFLRCCIHVRPFSFPGPNGGKQSPKEKRFTCPVLHCQVGDGVKRGA